MSISKNYIFCIIIILIAHLFYIKQFYVYEVYMDFKFHENILLILIPLENGFI